MPSRTRHISTQSFPPSPTKETFRDILVFEERLKQNAELLGRQRRKYEAFLGTLLCTIVTLGYKVFVTPSKDSPVAYVYMGSLLITLTMLALFFATGMYSEKIARGYKFIPQANRSIRTLNVHLNSRSYSLYSPRYLFPRLYSYLRPGPTRPHTTASTPPSPSRSVRQQRVPLEPIPPSSNPRGELIFSNKVNAPFREGYVKYRAEWEERRRRRMGSSPSYSADKKSSSSPSSLGSNNNNATNAPSSISPAWNLFSRNKDSSPYSSSISSRSSSPAVRHRRTLSSSTTSDVDEEHSRRLSASSPSPLHLNPPD